MSNIKLITKQFLMLLTFVVYLLRKLLAPISSKEPRKILVLYLSGIGDILCLTEFYLNLKKRYPDSTLYACLPSGYVDLQKSFFAFDSYISHIGYWDTLKKINNEHFDMVILPGWVLKDSILALLSNSKSIIGYINDLSFSNKFVNKFRLEAIGLRIPHIQKDMHHSHLSERPSAIADALHMQQVVAKEITIKRVAEIEDYVVFHASARIANKRWNPEHFVKVAIFLLDNRYCSCIYLIGDKYDKVVNDQIIHLAGSAQLINQAGKMNLLQTKDLIAKAKLFLGNDSGPMHIASLQGVPTLGLMGPYPPEICRPLGGNSRHVFHRFDCTGCNPGECNYDYRCMRAITPEEVITAIKSMLDTND